MVLFASAPNLRTLFCAQEGYAGLVDFSGLGVVPSSPHARAIKNWVLEAKGGALGLEVLTPDELKSHRRKVMKFEGSLLLAALNGSQDWGRCQRLYEAAQSWCAAGYSLKEIPLPPRDREALLIWQKLLAQKHLDPAWVGFFLPQDKPIALMGFDPVETWDIVCQNFSDSPVPSNLLVGLVEPAEMTVSQMAAMGSLEKLFGEPLRLEAQEGAPLETICVANDSQLGAAVQMALSTRPQIEKIVYQGAAALAGLEIRAEALGLTRSAQSQWEEAEQRERFVAAQRTAGWMEHWELWRARQAWAGVDYSAEQKKLEKLWQDEGRVTNACPELKQFPLRMTLREFLETAPRELWEASEQKFKKLEKIIPEAAAISKNIWLALLAAPTGHAEKTYSGVTALSLEEAWGLLDERTLVVLSETSPVPSESLLDRETVARKNRAALEGPEGAQTLARGWIRLTQAVEVAQTKASLDLCGAWVSSVREAASELPLVSFERKPLTASATVPRAYEMPAPVAASCKQWETLLKTPEVGWFDVLKLKGVWRPAAKSAEGLWVGNWAHAAMETEGGAGVFFGKLCAQRGTLPWRMALARAWSLAEHFQKELACARRLESEKKIDGVVNGVPTYGRMDSLVEVDGRQVVVDFKTSARTEKISTPDKTDFLARDGDGFQIWLYGRLLKAKENGSVAVCRLGARTSLANVREVEGPPLASEERMKKIYQTGVLGEGKKTFTLHGGAQGRLPYATRAQEGDDDND